MKKGGVNMLSIHDLKKSYHRKQVVGGISLEVGRGEAFGLLGPNGAGKSTTISMICGLLSYDEGDIQIAGLSVKDKPKAVKQKVGIVPQDIALYPTMSALDNLIFWGRMYGLKGRKVKERAFEVLQIVGLEDKAKDKIETFSGGMKRRINIGAALMHEPELLIMDEPTVGIDPQSRNHILETVKKLNKAGMTVIYTSHYMEEVEFLCERIAIMDHGKVIASGSKTELCSRLSGGTVLRMTAEPVTEAFVAELETLAGVEQATIQSETELSLLLNEAQSPLAEVIQTAVRSGVNIMGLQREEANLESLFLKLTGRTLRD